MITVRALCRVVATIGCMVMVSAHAATQGESLALTLDDAVRRALENNPDLAIILLETHVQTARIDESQTAFTPLFSTTFARSSTLTPPQSLLNGDGGVESKDFFSSTGVRQHMPWGSGTWSISWDSSRTTTNNPFASFDPTLQSGLQLAFSQPLLRDRKIDQARYQYMIAKRDEKTSDLVYRQAVVQTVAEVKRAYWILKATRANIDVQQRSLELARELRERTRFCVDAGDMPPLDLIQAEAEVAQRRENLIRAQTDADDGEDALRRLIVNAADLGFGTSSRCRRSATSYWRTAGRRFGS